MERTLVLIKPDGVQRRLTGAIVGRIERRGYKIIGLKLMRVTHELAERHYAEHRGKGFYEGLLTYITSGPVVALAVEGEDAIAQLRTMVGSTDPKKAAPGTIRGDWAIDVGRNLIHASDGPESAGRELDLFFGPSERLDYKLQDDDWVVE